MIPNEQFPGIEVFEAIYHVIKNLWQENIKQMQRKPVGEMQEMCK